MKKIISILIAICLFTILPCTAFAQQSIEINSDKQNYITYLDDGSYYVTTITESMARSTKTGTKTTEHYNNSGEMLWKVSVKGTFSYTGTSVTCTSASHTITIYNDNWYTYSQNSYASSNKAIADVVMKQKFLGIVTSTKTVNLTLTCDANGNLS